MKRYKQKIKMPEEFEDILTKPIQVDPVEWYALKKKNTRLEEALRKIHNYIANLEHYDMLKHILDIDKMVLNALHGEGQGE